MPNPTTPSTDTRPIVFLSVPSWDRGEHPWHATSVRNISARGKVHIVTTNHAQGDFLLRARNRHLYQFLHFMELMPGLTPRAPDFFFCIGSDIDFNDYFERIVFRNLPIVAGLYPVKDPNPPDVPPRWCINTLDGKTPDATGMMEIAAGGTDFICYRRDALETMIKSPLVAQYADDFVNGDKSRPHTHLFNFAVVNSDITHLPLGSKFEPLINPDWRKNRLLSEDYFASFVARTCGIPIMCDTTGYVGHWDGRTRYPTNPPPGLKLPSGPTSLTIGRNATVTPEDGAAQ